MSKCPSCGSFDTYQDKHHAEVICRSCGLIIQDRIVDTAQEWRAFDYTQKMRRERTGMALSLTKHDKGLSTVIGGTTYTDIASLSPYRRNEVLRMKKWQQQISTATERNLRYALSELDRIASYLGLGKAVREEAATIYRRVVEKGLVRGRSMESIISAALYITCRKLGISRTLDEIAEVVSLDKKEIGRTYRFVKRELGIQMFPTKPEEYVPRFASLLNLSGNVQLEAISVLKQLSESELLSGKGPTGIAAAAIYIAATLLNERKTQKEIAEVVGVTEVTIRNRYKELIDLLNLNPKMFE